MTQNDRVLNVWLNFLGFGMPILIVLAVVIPWSPAVQSMLTVLLITLPYATYRISSRTRRR